MFIFVPYFIHVFKMIPKVVIIVAGGKGERMNTVVPKQFLEIQGRPILMHTLEVFRRFDPEIQIVLVLPADQIDVWKSLCKKHAFALVHAIECGGSTRFHSVKNGLTAVSVPSLVAVHDGVRPLVSVETINACFDAASEYGTAVPVIDAIDSIRKVTDNGSVSVNRSEYKFVQTPQVFDGELLRKAYEQEFSEHFTDDASVVEALGAKMHLVAGNRENIKITTEMDLIIVNQLMNS
jgi:2-C-methyl-D-erythritol 4-phosphate cytidylyltransferase